MGEGLGGLARQFGGAAVDLEGAVGQPEFAQRRRRRAEGVGLDHVRPGLEIAAVDVADQVGAGQGQIVGTVLVPVEVLFHRQGQGLDLAAHGAVAQQNPLVQMIENVAHSAPLAVFPARTPRMWQIVKVRSARFRVKK